MKAENPQGAKVRTGIGNSGDTAVAQTRAVRQGKARQQSTREVKPLLERILSRENLTQAYHRVVSNQGAGGIDGIDVNALKSLLWESWSTTKQLLEEGRYQPQAIRRAWIKKQDGGERKLGGLRYRIFIYSVPFPTQLAVMAENRYQKIKTTEKT